MTSRFTLGGLLVLVGRFSGLSRTLAAFWAPLLVLLGAVVDGGTGVVCLGPLLLANIVSFLAGEFLAGVFNRHWRGRGKSSFFATPL